MSYELLIQHGSNIMYPPTVEGVTIEWERKGQPGKLTFEVVKTPGLSFQEGDPCRFSVDGTPVFYGFVFEKSRKGNNPNVIKCVVYDQLYYLKNKDTYVYTNKTASEVIKMVAEDFQLNVGELEDTGYKIASRVEDNQTLFDIIQNALDETLKATGQMYVLYDNVGKLTLKSLGNMKLNMLVDEDTAMLNLGQATVYAAATALGYGLAMCLFAGLREHLSMNDVPKPFKGLPIALITAGIMAMAFLGFSGIV